MTEDDVTRRLMRLKRRPTLADRDDDFLMLMIEEATDFYIDYTHYKDTGADIDNLICELAVLRINAEGVENVRVAKEGEVEREWYEGIPPMLMHRLNGNRRIQGLH